MIIGQNAKDEDITMNICKGKKLTNMRSKASDGIIQLVEEGVINGEAKTIHPGKIIAGFVLGTKKVYNFIDNNPVIEFHPQEYVNDPFVIAQNKKMVAINSAIEIDITGQVCSDSIGTKIFRGIGGQVDFIRGAAHSEGGKPIIALPSITKDGKVSRIVSQLNPGAGVVTSRGDVHYLSMPQAVWWIVLVLFVVIVLGSSLLPEIRITGKRLVITREGRDNVESLAGAIQKMRRGMYYKWLVANRLGKLAYQLLLQREHGKPRSVFAPLAGEGWNPGPEVQGYLEKGLHGSFAEFPNSYWHAFIPPEKTPLDHDVREVVEFLESKIEAGHLS